MRSCLLEYALSLLSVKPYRCRGCRKRFYRHGPPPAEIEILGITELDPEERETAGQTQKVQ